MPAETYRIFLFQGEVMPSNAKVEAGTARIGDGGFHILVKGNPEPMVITEIESAEIYSQSGSMSLILLRSRDGWMHLAVTRLLIGSSFAMVNVLKTRRLCKEINELISARLATSQPAE